MALVAMKSPKVRILPPRWGHLHAEHRRSLGGSILNGLDRLPLLGAIPTDMPLLATFEARPILNIDFRLPTFVCTVAFTAAVKELHIITSSGRRGCRVAKPRDRWLSWAALAASRYAKSPLGHYGKDLHAFFNVICLGQASQEFGLVEVVVVVVVVGRNG